MNGDMHEPAHDEGDLALMKRLRMTEAMNSFVHSVETRDHDSYNSEFNKVREEQDVFRILPEFSCGIGQQRFNACKNRFRDILPYDSTRVTLEVLEDGDRIPTEDEIDPYINASFVIGAEGTISYIASQGPVASTVDDFWKMIVQYKIEQIVMLCSLIENGRSKCEKYWPDAGETMNYAGAKITLLREEKLHEEYVVRSLNLEQTDANGKPIIRVVQQYHYIQWPDHGCPDTVEPLLDMLDHLHLLERPPASTKNILVHCSAGCGRTGTIIALDIAKNHLKLNTLPDNFKVYDLVLELRKQRASMVQSRDQYEFLHRALVELFKRQLAWQEDHGYMNWPSVVSQSHNGAKPDLLPNKNGSEVHDFDDEVAVEEPLEQPTRLPPILTMPQNVKQARTPSPLVDAAPGAAPSTFASIDGIPVPEWPHEPTVKPNGPEKMPWPDVISQTLM